MANEIDSKQLLLLGQRHPIAGDATLATQRSITTIALDACAALLEWLEDIDEDAPIDRAKSLAEQALRLAGRHVPSAADHIPDEGTPEQQERRDAENEAAMLAFLRDEPLPGEIAPRIDPEVREYA